MSETKNTISELSQKLDRAAQATLDYAKSQAADRTKVSASCTVEKRLVVENKEFTLANTLESQKIGLLVHKDQRKGSAALNNAQETSLQRAVTDALSLARFSVPDPFLTMPAATEAPSTKPLGITDCP